MINRDIKILPINSEQLTWNHETTLAPIKNRITPRLLSALDNRKTNSSMIYSSDDYAHEPHDRLNGVDEFTRSMDESDIELDFRHNYLTNGKAENKYNSYTTLRPSSESPMSKSNTFSSSDVTVFFERDMKSGKVVHDNLYSNIDEQSFFMKQNKVIEEQIDQSTPITLSELLLNSHNNSIQHSDTSLDQKRESFISKFPSMKNVNLTELERPTERMILDLTLSLKNDIVKAFTEIVISEDPQRYSKEKQTHFINRFLQGCLWERVKVKKKFSLEVVNICKYPISPTRKWDEFVLSVAEELPCGKVSLTEGLSKNDEMRLIYQIYGSYMQIRRRDGRRHKSSSGRKPATTTKPVTNTSSSKETDFMAFHRKIFSMFHRRI